MIEAESRLGGPGAFHGTSDRISIWVQQDIIGDEEPTARPGILLTHHPDARLKVAGPGGILLPTEIGRSGIQRQVQLRPVGDHRPVVLLPEIELLGHLQVQTATFCQGPDRPGTDEIMTHLLIGAVDLVCESINIEQRTGCQDGLLEVRQIANM